MARSRAGCSLTAGSLPFREWISFADLGLLDEILLEVAPVMLGGGTPLLPRRLLASELTLTTVGHDAQFIFLTYQVTRRADQHLVTPG